MDNINSLELLINKALEKNNSDAFYLIATGEYTHISINKFEYLKQSIVLHDKNDNIISLQEKIYKFQMLDEPLDKYLYDINKWIPNTNSNIYLCSYNWIIKVLKFYYSKHGHDKFIEGILKTELIEHSDKKFFKKRNILEKIHTDIDKDACSVCLEKLMNSEKSLIVLACGHVFHFSCIKKQNTCPLCRNEVDYNDDYSETESEEFLEGFLEGPLDEYVEYD